MLKIVLVASMFAPMFARAEMVTIDCETVCAKESGVIFKYERSQLSSSATLSEVARGETRRVCGPNSSGNQGTTSQCKKNSGGELTGLLESALCEPKLTKKGGTGSGGTAGQK